MLHRCTAVLVAGIAASAAARSHGARTPGLLHTREDAVARRATQAGAGEVIELQAGATMTASPAQPTFDLTNVTVSWSGVQGAAATDWIAQYCQGAAVDGWLEWSYVTAAPGYASGSGNITFLVARGHCDFEFRYYRDPSPYTLLATSNAVSWPGGPLAPYQVHVAYADTPSSAVTVSWTTNVSCTASPAVLMVGTQPGVYNLPNVTVHDCVSYAASDMCQQPATIVSPDYWQWPGVFHHALVTGLTPNTRYWALPTQGGVAGIETSFVTAKAPGYDAAPTRFVVYADMGISGAPGAADTTARVAARLGAGEQLDFVAHVGDLGYALGNVAVWDAWMSFIEPVASRLPYMVSIGNHEYDYTNTSGAVNDPSGAHGMWSPSFWNGGVDSQGECGVPPSRRFRTPASAGAPGNGVFWYSIDVGLVHIAFLSSEHDPSSTAPMGQWLAADLAAVNRTATPWVFVAIHRPLYESEAYAGDWEVSLGLRSIMEPLLVEQGVDVVLAGHYHSFMRTCAARNGTCVDSGGIVHYTTGAAGASLDEAPLYPEDWVIKYDGAHFGYSILEAANATALRMSWYWNQDDSLQDDVWLYKQ